jgi:hypothetical protein
VCDHVTSMRRCSPPDVQRHYCTCVVGVAMRGRVSAVLTKAAQAVVLQRKQHPSTLRQRALFALVLHRDDVWDAVLDASPTSGFKAYSVDLNSVVRWRAPSALWHAVPANPGRNTLQDIHMNSDLIAKNELGCSHVASATCFRGIPAPVKHCVGRLSQ